MEGFTYHNIFDTKGVEYLAIIAFFAILIPFWIILNRQVRATKQLQRKLGILTASMLKIPQGIFFSTNHMWTHLDSKGIAKVGADDLLLHLTGEVKFSKLRKPGEIVQKEDMLAVVSHNGKQLRIVTPISGEIIAVNALLQQNPEMLNDDPYQKGWMYKIKPSRWIAETSKCYIAEEATGWSVKELERFKDFLATSVQRYAPEPTNVILQDGGELIDQPLSALPEDVWKDFEHSFLGTKPKYPHFRGLEKSGYGPEYYQ
ncbi:MAG: glycine cleavage system protein H [Prolixibacteraceae bacterium]|jgi:glycine cleavage system H protein|nr:glycine cleavage system protein H [Prolixibacteraceae bacterium]